MDDQVLNNAQDTDFKLGPVVLDVAGYTLTEQERVLLCHPYVGGVIFFLRNFESPEQIAQLITQIRSVRPNILIAVDQEGGRVQRFKEGFTRLPSLQSLANVYCDGQSSHYMSEQFIKDSAWLMASELLAVGVDISFAPVVDADDTLSKVIGDRSFSKEIEAVKVLGRFYIEGMNEAGMAATLKHFPGHGAVIADSHLSLPVDNRSFDDVCGTDMKSFSELLPIAGGVMPAHILFPEVDDNPVGFSKFWLQDVLREKLGYKGVVFSDDLSMEGASVAGGHEKRAVAALRAGCDSVVVCNNPKKAQDILDTLSDKHWPIDGRLSLMKADGGENGFPSLVELRDSARWQRAVQNLQSMRA